MTYGFSLERLKIYLMSQPKGIFNIDTRQSSTASRNSRNVELKLLSVPGLLYCTVTFIICNNHLAKLEM